LMMSSKISFGSMVGFNPLGLPLRTVSHPGRDVTDEGEC